MPSPVNLECGPAVRLSLHVKVSLTPATRPDKRQARLEKERTARERERPRASRHGATGPQAAMITERIRSAWGNSSSARQEGRERGRWEGWQGWHGDMDVGRRRPKRRTRNARDRRRLARVRPDPTAAPRVVAPRCPSLPALPAGLAPQTSSRGFLLAPSTTSRVRRGKLEAEHEDARVKGNRSRAGWERKGGAAYQRGAGQWHGSQVGAEWETSPSRPGGGSKGRACKRGEWLTSVKLASTAEATQWTETAHTHTKGSASLVATPSCECHMHGRTPLVGLSHTRIVSRMRQHGCMVPRHPAPPLAPQPARQRNGVRREP